MAARRTRRPSSGSAGAILAKTPTASKPAPAPAPRSTVPATPAPPPAARARPSRASRVSGAIRDIQQIQASERATRQQPGPNPPQVRRGTRAIGTRTFSGTKSRRAKRTKAVITGPKRRR